MMPTVAPQEHQGRVATERASIEMASNASIRAEQTAPPVINSLDDIIANFDPRREEGEVHRSLRLDAQAMQAAKQAQIRQMCQPWGVKRATKNAQGKWCKRLDADLKKDIEKNMIERARELRQQSGAATDRIATERAVADTNSDAFPHLFDGFACAFSSYGMKRRLAWVLGVSPLAIAVLQDVLPGGATWRSFWCCDVVGILRTCLRWTDAASTTSVQFKADGVLNLLTIIVTRRVIIARALARLVLITSVLLQLSVSSAETAARGLVPVGTCKSSPLFAPETRCKVSKTPRCAACMIVAPLVMCAVCGIRLCRTCIVHRGVECMCASDEDDDGEGDALCHSLPGGPPSAILPLCAYCHRPCRGFHIEPQACPCCGIGPFCSIVHMRRHMEEVHSSGDRGQLDSGIAIPNRRGLGAHETRRHRPGQCRCRRDTGQNGNGKLRAVLQLWVLLFLFCPLTAGMQAPPMVWPKPTRDLEVATLSIEPFRLFLLRPSTTGRLSLRNSIWSLVRSRSVAALTLARKFVVEAVVVEAVVEVALRREAGSTFVVNAIWEVGLPRLPAFATEQRRVLSPLELEAVPGAIHDILVWLHNIAATLIKHRATQEYAKAKRKSGHTHGASCLDATAHQMRHTIRTSSGTGRNSRMNSARAGNGDFSQPTGMVLCVRT